MSRLYYKPTIAAMQSTGGTPNNSAKEYLEKVSKIIPSEIIAAYLAMIGFVPLIKKQNLQQPAYYIIFGLGLVGTYFYTDYQSLKGKPKMVRIILAVFSFLFWAYNITGDKVFPTIFDSAIASILLIAFSLASGKIPLD
jgi:hypothetical protein